MAPDKVFVVRSGPNIDRLKIIAPIQELKQGKQFLVGYVGVIGQQEGIQYLIDAVHYLVHDLKRTDIHFTLVGGGPSLEEFKLMAVDKNVSGYVNFTGRVSDQVLLEVLNTSDVCVNPDEVNEMNDKSTMNKIMEYMAVGKPIVQFDVTEGRYSAGDASLYAEPNNAIDIAHKIITLLDDPKKRTEMGKIGRDRIEKVLAWPYEVPNLLAAYEKVFKK
jgi:glycosyltransferase involved in cell wall biosynthesis